MHFMMLMIPGVYQGASGQSLGDGFAPSAEKIARMMKYNEDLKNAGALVTLNGLHPPSKGTRVSFTGAIPSVTDGPFAETKEVLGGFWIIDVASKKEAVEWAAKCPAEDGDVIEIRKIFEAADFEPHMANHAA